LDFSKIEANKLDIECVDMDLQGVMEEVCSILALDAHRKGLEFMCDMSMLENRFVKGDPVRIKQILSNLVRNAIKFTEEGHVIVSVREESKDGAPAAFHFKVEDTGIGISSEEAGLIFEKFTQADGSTTRRYGGTGLGLAISKQLVDMMHGSMWLESSPGEGSIFHVRVDLPLGEPVGAPAAMDVGLLEGLGVFIVDDNPINRCIIRGLMDSWGVDVMGEAASGREAVSRIRGLCTGHERCDVILLDFRMPDMNGLEVLECLKEQMDAGELAVMMLTSDDQVATRERCRKLGIRGYLVKPIMPSELQKAMLEVVGDRFVKEEQDVREGVGPHLNLNMLLAEDNGVNRTLARILLEKAGAVVDCAVNGKEAVKAWSEGDHDLILMDIQMPEMDGLEATHLIREMEKGTGAHIPILALTAHAMKGDRERFLAAGMDDYISKPIDFEELVTKISGIGGSKKERDESAIDPEYVLDIQALERRVCGDKTLMHDILSQYSEDARNMLQEAEQALTSSDMSGLRALAHSLRGMSSTISASILSREAEALEQVAAENDLESARNIVARMRTGLDITLRKISEILGSYTETQVCREAAQ